MQKLLILFTCFIITVPLTAQVAINSNIQQYTTDNGLPSNGIKGMQWDEKNEFLWMATEAGIVRFNGVDIKSYSKENMPVITSERMLFMVQNNSHRIYTSDQSGNIFLVDKSKPVLWRKTTVSSGVNPYLGQYHLLGVSDAFFNTKVNDKAAYIFTTGSSRIVPISDTAYLVHYLDKLYYHSTGLKEPVLSFGSEHIADIFKINNNCFIINDKKQIFLLNTKEQRLSPVTIAGNDNTLLNAPHDESILYWQTGMANPVFINAEKAWLLTYDGVSIKFKLISEDIPLGTYIKSVQYSEKNNLLFIGTESKGLIVIKKNRVLSKRRNTVNTQNRNSYYSQIELANGNILTNESDIIGDDVSNNNTLPIPGKFSFNISQTSEDALWYTRVDPKAGHTALHRYNKITGQTTVYPKIKWGDIVTASVNKIYLANLNGIGRLDDDSLLMLYNYTNNLKGTVIFDFTEISPGILAIATCAGLLRFNTATNRLDTIFTKENICVRSIWKYKDYIFFGTYGSGFYMYKNGIIKSMPLDKNRYLLYAHCFIPDDSGYCWISTNRGLFKSSLAELENAFEKNAGSVYYHYFGKKDGMEMTELNGGCTPCALVMKNKTISFPTMDGLLWVDPRKAIPVLPDGEIFIDEISIDNKKINPDSLHIKSLPYQAGEILIQLGFSAWCNKENIYLDYQLNDTVNWKPINIDNEAVIRLNGLSSGSYVLRIRKLNGFGFNNFTYKVIRFKISTPWYKQWWFYALASLTFIGLIAFYLSLRTRQYKIRQRKLEEQVAEKTKELLEKNEVLEKNNTIKTRLISIISHDIVTPLKFVTVAGKKLIEKKNLMSDELQEETIREMTNTSQELQLLSTNILNWIKYQNENRRLAKENFNLNEMISQVTGILTSLAKQKNLQLVNTVNTELEVYQYFEPLKILVYNLLTNAINFSEKGNITIAAKTNDENLIITVEDEGAGMTADQIKNIMADQFIISSANIDNKKGNGLGYLIIKDLLKMMDAKLNINSEKGKGTIVSVKLPKQQ